MWIVNIVIFGTQIFVFVQSNFCQNLFGFMKSIIKGNLGHIVGNANMSLDGYVNVENVKQPHLNV